jgi:uncharacterized membrane protein YhfC
LSSLLIILSILAVLAWFGVLLVGLLLIFKSLQSTRGWFQKTTVGLRAIEQQTSDLAERGAVVAASLVEVLEALEAATQLLGEPEPERD